MSFDCYHESNAHLLTYKRKIILFSQPASLFWGRRALILCLANTIIFDFFSLYFSDMPFSILGDHIFRWESAYMCLIWGGTLSLSPLVKEFYPLIVIFIRYIICYIFCSSALWILLVFLVFNNFFGGEGFIGTTIKDTWTKSRGRVEAEEQGGFGWGGVQGWGKNADNCNWITIQI